MENKQLTSVFIDLRQRLRGLAAAIAGDDEADDALQEAFYRLWRRGDCNANRKEMEAMTVTTVKNMAIDTVRKRHQTTTDMAKTAAQDFADNEKERRRETEERFEAVKRIIFKELDKRTAQALWQRDYQEWSFEEIAEEMQTSEANVRQMVSRGRKKVREIYQRIND